MYGIPTLRRRHVAVDGTVSEINATAVHDTIKVWAEISGQRVELPDVLGGIWNAIDAYPELVTVGLGATRIDWDSIDEQFILNELRVVDDPLAQGPDAEWAPEVEALAEEILGIERAEGFENVAVVGCMLERRWLSLNGRPAAVLLHGSDSAVIVGRGAEDRACPYVDVLLTWEYQDLPGGPMQMEGQLSLGKQGNIWVTQTSGDMDRELAYVWASAAIEDHIARFIRDRSWIPAFLRSGGFAGWGPEKHDALFDQAVMGQKLWLDDRVSWEGVCAALIAYDPRVRVMCQALDDPKSQPGAVLYGFLQDLSAPHWRIDWDDIDGLLWVLTGPQSEWPTPPEPEIDEEALDDQFVVTAHPTDLYSAELHVNCVACCECEGLGVPLRGTTEAYFLAAAREWIREHRCDPERPGALYNPDLG